MDFLTLAGAFGGGLIGAYMGALPAFIMTGLFALVGGLLQAAGVTGDIALLGVAFNSFIGPHTAFAGGVAAAAYAGRKKELASGADILSSLNGLGSPDVLLVGGLFGLAGGVIKALLAMIPVFGAITDLPGTTVFILALVCRFGFGNSGLLGSYPNGGHEWFSGGKGFGCNVMLGLGLGLAISTMAAYFFTTGNDVALGMWPFVCFGFSAVTLIFTQTGFATPATHHISLIGAYASVVGVTAWGPTAGVLFGTLFAVIASLVGDFVGKSFNTNVDSHIDPPATTIWILACIVHLIAMGLGAAPGAIIIG